MVGAVEQQKGEVLLAQAPLDQARAEALPLAPPPAPNPQSLIALVGGRPVQLLLASSLRDALQVGELEIKYMEQGDLS